MGKKDEMAAERLWEETFEKADAVKVLFDKGMPIKDIAYSMRMNEAEVESKIKLAAAFPKGNRWKNVPIDVYVWASKYPDPQKMFEIAWNKKWHANDFRQDFRKFRGETFMPVSQRERQTPIETALGVDEEGMTTAKKLYAFLGMDQTHYSRWVKKNIEENIFAEEGEDYWVLAINGENPLGGRPTRDYKLTATFAKKLAMASQTPKGEAAREYFIRVEQNAKNFANGKFHCLTPQGGAFTPEETGELILSVANNFKDYLPKETVKRMVATVLELRGVKQLA